MIIPMENLKLIKKLKDFRLELSTLLEDYPLSLEEYNLIIKELELIENQINDLLIT